MRQHLTLTTAALVLFAGAAVAAPENSSTPASTTTSDKAPASDVLGGPQVDDTTPPGASETFDGRRRMGEGNRVNLRELSTQIRRLSAPSTPEELRISPEVGEQVRVIVREHASAMQAYTKEHEEQINKLRAEAGLPERPAQQGRGAGADRRGANRPAANRPGINQPARGARDANSGRTDAPAAQRPGDAMEGMDGPDRPARTAREGGADRGPRDGARGARGADRTPPTPEQRAAMEKLADLMAKGPQSADAAKKIMALLSPAQRDAVEKGIKEAEQRRQAQRRERAERPEGAPERGERPARRARPEGGPEGRPGGRTEGNPEGRRNARPDTRPASDDGDI